MSYITLVRHGQANTAARDEHSYDRLSPLGGVMEQGEMALPQQGSDRLLPTALYARWRAA